MDAVPERIECQTSDNVTLIGDLYRPSGTAIGGVLLLHMMPADRTSWQAFAAHLLAHNFLALALDLRGHGESIHQTDHLLDYRTFTTANHQASRFDVLAGLSYLKEHERLAEEQLGLVGASIGANLALQALADHPRIPWGILLSPGLNYHGIDTALPLTRLAPTQAVYLAASNDDDYAFKTIQELNHLRDERTDKRELSGAGHGTTMWEHEPELMDNMVAWIEDHTPQKAQNDLQ